MPTYPIALILLSMFLMTGCTPRGPKNAMEAAGEYVFLAPGGEVEVVILNADATYRHELYADITSYRDSVKLLHTSSAAWTYKRSTLTFIRWIDYFDDPNPAKRLEPPRQMISSSAHWSAPTRKHDAIILLSEEFHYAFLRVVNRAQGAKTLDEVSRAGR